MPGRAGDPPRRDRCGAAYRAIRHGADADGPFGAAAAGIESLRAGYEPADTILVRKAERRMYLMRANRIIAEYPIRLGLNPIGHKEREGDFRTPEGLYQLVGRNPRSDYFLSLEVSYPNDEDRARAKKSGVPPGGLIMIHGQPNLPRKSPEYYANYDWTNGCIAVSNSDMVDIWLRTQPGTRHRDPTVMRRVEVSVAGADEPVSVDARVTPTGSLENLSQQEVDRLLDTSRGGLYPTYRRCSLAVLNAGGETDDARMIFERYDDFDIRIVRQAWGVKLELRNAPAGAFVDGRMIRGIQEHLFAVLRDILYIHGEVYEHGSVELEETQGITNAVYRILRNAGVLRPRVRPDIVVCWGGHSISREEYDYTKRVGYELGLRGLNVCTGCGPGAMKGPMKGAAIGHAKQRIHDGRYIGLTEPGIVAAEPPNAIVNQLVILPDIEKRLEAFVRTGHGIVVFPGGAGTAEEILYLLGILLDPANEEQPFPVVFTGPPGSEEYFGRIECVSCDDARAAGGAVLPHHRRRSGRGGARDAARHGRRPRVPPAQERRLQLQLDAGGRSRAAAAVRADARGDGGARHPARPSSAPACVRAAPRVLGDRHRKRQGAGHPPDRGARPFRTAWRSLTCSSRSARCSSRSYSSAA